MRRLVLQHQAAPIVIDYSAGPLRQAILEHPDDDVDLWNIWEVPPTGSLQPSVEVTQQFARTWAMELATGATLDQHIAAAPAFVVHHARTELVKWWLKRGREVPVIAVESFAA